MERKQTIHEVLAKSYLTYLIASLVGLFTDSFLSVPITVPFAKTAAIICLGLGPLLIAWAQYTSRHEKYDAGQSHYFARGPYRVVRNPTHLGLLILVAGYTFISGSLIFFATTLLGYIISNIFFTKYETILTESYGEHYQNYKTKVKKIL